MADVDDGVYVENSGRRYKVMVLRDFIRFRDFCTSDDGWSEAYKSKDGSVAVHSRKPDEIPGEKPSGIDVARTTVYMPTREPRLLYDTLHDGEFRKTWDKYMVDGYNICKLNDYNDVGYYHMKFPWPLSNRDFCNMRSWMEFTNGDYIIFNHSEPHAECPEKKGVTRARSILSGYMMRNNPEGEGCLLYYITHSDLGGSIPKKILQVATTKSLPDAIKSLESRAGDYEEWSRAQYPAGHIHSWTTSKHDWKSPLNYPRPDISDESAMHIIDEAVAEAGLAGSTTLHGSRAGSLRKVSSNNSLYGTSTPLHKSDSDHSIDGSPAPRLRVEGVGEEEAAVMKQMASKIDDLTRQNFLLQQQSDGGGMSLAPVAPARSGDSEDVLRFRAIMNDACNFVDRQFVQEGYVPTTREYLTRLHYLLEGTRRTTSLQQ